WARAQAWGILGWTLTHVWSGEARFRAAAERAADWWLAHAPADRVAFWDFDDPKIPNTFRDTSATAIVAASLLTLAPLAATTPRSSASTRCGWRSTTPSPTTTGPRPSRCWPGSPRARRR